MASQTNSPSTVVSVAGAGTDWNNPSNAVSSNDSHATTASILGAGNVTVNARIVKGDSIGSTNRGPQAFTTTDSTKTFGSSSDLWGETWTVADINASDFGSAIVCSISVTSDYLKATDFGFTIPSGSTIDGIVVNVEGKASTTACVLPQTLVLTTSGEKRIDEIVDGDSIISFNTETRLFETDLVSSVYCYEKIERTLYQLVLNTGIENLSVTADHKIYTQKGFKSASNIRRGDVILKNGEFSVVVDKKLKVISSNVYTLGVNKNNNFIANGIVVHNFTATNYYAKIDHIQIQVYYTEASSSIKTVNGLAKASVKTINGLAIASVKTLNTLP